MKPSNLFLALACLMAGACSVQAKAEHNIAGTADQVTVQQAQPDVEFGYTMQSEATTLSAVGCCDQGYEISSTVEAGCCDQGYQVNSMAGTSRSLIAVAFAAFLALLALNYNRTTHTFQFRQ